MKSKPAASVSPYCGALMLFREMTGLKLWSLQNYNITINFIKRYIIDSIGKRLCHYILLTVKTILTYLMYSLGTFK